MHVQRKVIAIAAGAGALATFLPWAHLGMISIDGTLGIGWDSFVLFAVCAAIALFTPGRPQPIHVAWRVLVVMLASSAIVIVLHFRSAAGIGDSEGSVVELGAGAYLVILAGITSVIAASMFGHRVPGVIAGVGWALVIAIGFVHLAHDDDGGHLCLKSRWSLVDNMVDVHDYVGDAVHRSPVTNALEKCGLLEFVPQETAPPVQYYTPPPRPTGPACHGRDVATGRIEYGHCTDGTRGVGCKGEHYAGVCEGAAICCLD